MRTLILKAINLIRQLDGGNFVLEYSLFIPLRVMKRMTKAETRRKMAVRFHSGKGRW